MKKMIMAFVASIVIVLIVLIGFTIHGRDLRQTELNNAMYTSMESAMKVLLLEEGGPKTQAEWEQMFVQSLVVQIESDSEMTVHIGEDSDMEKGILTAEAVLRFRHPIGTIGTVSTGIRTIILEEYEVE